MSKLRLVNREYLSDNRSRPHCNKGTLPKTRDQTQGLFTLRDSFYFLQGANSMLKRLLLGSGIILTLAIGAAGQTDWKGFYAGGNVGVTAGRATADTSTVFSATGYFANSSVATINLGGRQKLQPNRFNGGGQVGYNWQSGHIVYGVEV